MHNSQSCCDEICVCIVDP